MRTPTEFQDPKIQLILSIQRHDEKITWLLENNRYNEAGKSLYWLLDRMDITNTPDDEPIRQIRNTLTLDNYNQLDLDDFAYAIRELHKFLNRTYYKGFSNNRPPTRKSSIENIGNALK